MIKIDELSEETKQRIQNVQAKIDEIGIRDIKYTVDPTCKKEDYEKLVNEMCFMLESYFNKDYNILDIIIHLKGNE